MPVDPQKEKLLRLVIRPMWKVLLNNKKYPAQRACPKVRFHPRSGGLSYADRNLVSVGVGGGFPLALGILLHELCHKVVGNHHNHDDLYNRTLKAAFLEIWPVLKLDGYRSHGYDLSHGAEKQLEGIWEVNPLAVLTPLGLAPPHVEIPTRQFLAEINRARVGSAFPESRNEGDLTPP